MFSFFCYIEELEVQLKTNAWQSLYFEEYWRRITYIEAIRSKKKSLGQISVRRWQKSQVKLAAQFKPIFFVAYFIKPLGKDANIQP